MEDNKDTNKFQYLNPNFWAIVLLVVIIGLFYKDTINKTMQISPIQIEENKYQASKHTAEPLLQTSNKNDLQKSPDMTAAQSVEPADGYQNEDNIVVFNPSSLKYHKSYCEWAKKCKRCIRIPVSNAIEQGGKPCRVCGKEKN